MSYEFSGEHDDCETWQLEDGTGQRVQSEPNRISTLRMTRMSDLLRTLGNEFGSERTPKLMGIGWKGIIEK